MRAKTVLISGLGIAGPTLAYWLRRYGFEPMLVERAPALRAGGYVVDFWGLGYDIADKMELLPKLHAAGYHVKALRIVDRAGRRVSGLNTDVIYKLTGGRFVSVARSDLSRLLVEELRGTCEIAFGDSISALQDDADGVRAAFESGAERRFDLVIGADGLNSAVRAHAFGPQNQFEKTLGYGVAAFEASGYRPRDEDVYVMYGVPGRQLARFALHGDRTLFLFITTGEFAGTALDSDMDVQKRLLAERFGGIGWESAAILEALRSADELYFDRVSQIRMPHWSKGRICLLGDAAFCVSFLAGQGTALAMAAAYILAGELGRTPDDHAAAFGRYETILRAFIVAKQDGAARFASAFAPRTQLGLLTRSVVLRALNLPFAARYAIGPDLLDQLELPEYPQR
jgi:2-polyprenyl-6-methoxyphenol hydroxylase-like FAD-dependent oxidoreductase